jgi:cytoskeletal protein CcmA (bactofilin family)
MLYLTIQPLLNMPIASLKAKVNSLMQNNSSDNDNNTSLGRKIEHISANFKATPTILAKDLKIEGDISSAGLIEIEGFVKGNIKGNSVIIREGGNMEGELMAESLSVKGKFSGTIRAKNINISSKARITGVVEYCSLSVEDGACIDGQFKQVGSN